KIERTAIVNLTAIRTLGGTDEGKTQAVRRYILGLTLLAAVAPNDLFLRQGCLLVQSADSPPVAELVYRDGKRSRFTMSLEEAESYAKSAADAFGVGEDRQARFDKKLAQAVFKKASK